jgi:hypothetical protein
MGSKLGGTSGDQKSDILGGQKRVDFSLISVILDPSKMRDFRVKKVPKIDKNDKKVTKMVKNGSRKSLILGGSKMTEINEKSTPKKGSKMSFFG